MPDIYHTEPVFVEDGNTLSLSQKIDTVAPVVQKDSSSVAKGKSFAPHFFSYDSANFTYSLDSSTIEAYQTTKHISVDDQASGFVGKSIAPMLKHQDGVFLLLLVCFFFIGRMMQRGSRFFLEGLQLLVTFREKKDEFDEITIKEFWGNIFLILLPAFLLSLLCYQFLQNGDTIARPPNHFWMTIIGYTLLIALFVLFKYLFYLLIGYTFDLKEEVSNYLRVYFTLNELFGVLIFIPTLVYLYFGTHIQLILYLVLGLFIFVRIILFLRIIRFFLSKKANILTGILYLCTIELPPFAFCAIGVVLLYKEDFFCVL